MPSPKTPKEQAFFISLFLSGFFYATPATAADTPQMAVAEVLSVDWSDDWPLHEYLTREHPKTTSRHKGVISNSFRAFTIAAEHDALQQNCGGKYIEGDMCGLHTHPLNCSFDIEPPLHLTTDEQNTDTATVSYHWEPGDKPLITYQLIKTAQGWQIDGVSCRNGTTFNWNSGK